MKALFISLLICFGYTTAFAIESGIAQAEANAATTETLVLNGTQNEAERLVAIGSKLISLEEVIIDGISSDETAMDLVSSIAACSNVRTLIFRNCKLVQLPVNLRMLTQVSSFRSEFTTVIDGEQFYNAIADMPNVLNVSVTGSDFRVLPNSFSRMRVMENIHLINEDLQLARGYDLNTKTPEQLRSTKTVQFGFGEDALNLNYTCYNAEAGVAHMGMFRDVLQGVHRTSNEFYSPVNAAPFRKQHPLVHPSVSGVEIYPDVYSVNNLTGSVLEYGSGTRIIVPAMAFVNANGEAVSGNVDITYTEFRDQVDIVLSGIPMTYDSAGTTGDFESAGMFEMEAAQNGREVFLAPGKEIGMKFAVVDTASDYNFYVLDETQGWQYLENTGEAESDEVPVTPATTRSPEVLSSPKYEGADTFTAPSVSFAVTQYCNAVRNIRVRNWIRDTTAFDTRYNDTCYYGMERGARENSRLSASQKSRRSSMLYLKKLSGGDDYTVVSLHKVRGVRGTNTELSAYAGYKWKIDGKMNNREVNDRFGPQSGINDCRVVQDGSEYYLELKYFWGFDRVKAEPVRLNKDNEVVSVPEKQKENLFNSYTKKLNRRRDMTARNNRQQVVRQEQRVQRTHNDSLRAWRGIRRCMNEEEKTMDFPAWRSYTNGLKSYVAYHTSGPLLVETSVLKVKAGIAMNNAITVYQDLNLPRLGIFNCDRVAGTRNSNSDRPLKVFVNKAIVVAGAVIVPAVLHVVDKVRNQVLSFSRGTMGGGVRASYYEDATYYLLATDDAGNLYKVSEQEFASAQMSGETTFEFEGTQISGPGTTPETVRRTIADGDAAESIVTPD